MTKLSLSLVLLFPIVLSAEPKVNSLGMSLVPIPVGSFRMGAGDAPPKSRAEWNEREYDEAPAHTITITRAFLMGATEVTNAQYERFDPKHKAFRGKGGVSTSDDEPVTYVTWHEAVAFCEWLSKAEGKPYRLPTEAEWEYACRAGTTTAFSTGDKITAEQANIGLKPDGTPHKGTVPVGRFAANAWGLHDMHGNVLEWCLDWHGPYDAAEQTDPVGRDDGYAKIARGWCHDRVDNNKGSHRLWRSANRSGFLREDANRLCGFRVVLGELPTTKPLPVVRSAYQIGMKQTPAPTEGPDPAKPFFKNFLADKQNAEIAKDAFGPVFANHNHYGACCVCPNGDVLMCWYSTVTESGRELLQAATRLPAGSDRWQPASLFFDVPDMNDHAPVLFCDGKRIFHFCTQSLRGWDHATNILRHSDDNGVTWSKPTIILDRDHPQALSQPCSAFRAKNGTLVLACDGDLHKDERNMTSPDGGKTWTVRKGDMRAVAGKYAIHPAIAPLSEGDGGTINFLRGPDPMPIQRSADFGDTWTQSNSPFPGIKSGQKITALRLASGALLMVSIDNPGKNVDRGKTFAALSFDDGKTWPHVRQLYGVGGYMSSAQAPNGTIFVCGSRTGATAFNEAWLKQGPAAK
jgi:formylglycine-generating enzyme